MSVAKTRIVALKDSKCLAEIDKKGKVQIIFDSKGEVVEDSMDTILAPELYRAVTKNERMKFYKNLSDYALQGWGEVERLYDQTRDELLNKRALIKELHKDIDTINKKVHELKEAKEEMDDHNTALNDEVTALKVVNHGLQNQIDNLMKVVEMWENKPHYKVFGKKIYIF